jgi:hypothetical protein
MSGPGGALMRLFMDDDMNTGRSNGGTIEIKVAVDLGPGREIGIDARALHKVERERMACGSSRHQRWRGKKASVVERPAIKWFLKV